MTNAALGATVTGISKRHIKAHDKLAKMHGIGTLLASDEGNSTCQAYGTWVEKNRYGRSFMGIARATFVIAGSRRKPGSARGPVSSGRDRAMTGQNPVIRHARSTSDAHLRGGETLVHPQSGPTRDQAASGAKFRLAPSMQCSA